MNDNHEFNHIEFPENLIILMFGAFMSYMEEHNRVVIEHPEKLNDMQREAMRHHIELLDYWKEYPKRLKKVEDSYAQDDFFVSAKKIDDFHHKRREMLHKLVDLDPIHI